MFEWLEIENPYIKKLSFTDSGKSDQKVDHLRNRVSKLEERNNILDERSHRLELVEHAVGEEQVKRIADEQNRREEWERNQRKRQRGRAEWSL